MAYISLHNLVAKSKCGLCQGKELSPELTQALLDKASEIMDLRNFEMEGIELRLKGFDIQQGRLTLQAEARVS